MKKVFLVIIALVQFIIVNAQSSGGHEYVDLGLSVKWATCNVGASSTTELGYLFRWGETTYAPKDGWDGYKYAKVKDGRAKKILKYTKKGWRADNKTQLEQSDDAAYDNWGAGWRMPTKDEADELIYNCTWEMVKLSGVYCVKAKSKLNGKCIYFPVPSYTPGSYGEVVFNQASYWTLNLGSSDDFGAYYLHVDNSRSRTYEKSRAYRCPVRPVRK